MRDTTCSPQRCKDLLIPASHSLLQKLEQAVDLTEAERAAVRALPARPEAIARDRTVIHARDRALSCFLLTQGLMSVSETTLDGHRQITALHVPGDLFGLQGLCLGTHDSDVQTLTDCVVTTIDHEPVQRLCAEQPRLAAEIWRVTMVDASILREWTVVLGRRSGMARTAHLCCEMVLRLSAVGQCVDGRAELPLAPMDLGQALGLSAAQVDQALQELGRAGLASFREGCMAIHDWPALTSLAGFQPDYLHLRDVEALVSNLPAPLH